VEESVYPVADYIFYMVQPRTWVITHGHCYQPSPYVTLPAPDALRTLPSLALEHAVAMLYTHLAAAQRYQTIVLLRETWTMKTRERENRHYRY
jgi:hypothetical protein